MRSGIRKWSKLACAMLFAVMALGACTSGDELEKTYTAKAQTGDPEAQYQLGRLYFDANGVDHNDKKGTYWIRKAAEQGHPMAQADLGMLYAMGLIVRKNLIEADKWLTLSSRQGYGPGTRGMKDLEEKMQKDQIEKAKELADNWKPIRPAS